MKNKLILILIILTSLGCSATNIVTISVIEPAPVTIPPYMQAIGTINRSIASEKTEKIDNVDKIFSLEGLNLDEDGAERSMMGLIDELRKNNRFSEVKYIKNADLKSSGLGLFPPPLSWNVVEKICQKNELDGLFILESFDTDSKISYSAVPVTIEGPLGLEVPAIEHNASITTLINTGWRIYDPISKIILDEFSISESVTSSGKGINPAAAAASVVGRKNAVMQISSGIGQSYALNLLPYKIRVRRDYYVRGTDNFKIAKRRAQTGNWDGAAELWLKETKNTDGEVAGRACYNMAIISEINGDLDLAIQWAQKAYVDYNNKLALEYIDILEYRKARNYQLKRQQE